jgi:hypothetical protein
MSFTPLLARILSTVPFVTIADADAIDHFVEYRCFVFVGVDQRPCVHAPGCCRHADDGHGRIDGAQHGDGRLEHCGAVSAYAVRFVNHQHVPMPELGGVTEDRLHTSDK